MMFVIPDTSLAWNFHALGRIPLMQAFVHRPALQPCRAEWGQEVEQEVLRHIGGAHGDLETIFGDSIMPTPSQQLTTGIVRDRAFKRIGDFARSHTGEAETIAIWSERADFGDRVLCITEDTDFVRFCWRTGETGALAHRLADGRLFIPVTTDDVLSSCVAARHITASDKAGFETELRRQGRPYIGPASTFR